MEYPPHLNLDYHADGNISFKTGAGNYTYGSATARPHAVTNASGQGSYGYDANGNMTSRYGATITWTSSNLPKKINKAGGDSAEFWYGTNRSRYKQVAITGGTSATTRYIGPHFEVETRGGLTIYRHFILTGDRAIAQYERRSDGTTPFRYLHYDNLGSVVATTGWSGPLAQRFEFDPFGARDITAGSPPDDTELGFTGHEHLDSVDLIHMNGRVQDPVLGRFISADPFVQAPYYGQSLNRYSYVWNSPLTLVDPSGFAGECYGDSWLDSECQGAPLPQSVPPTWIDTRPYLPDPFDLGMNPGTPPEETDRPPPPVFDELAPWIRDAIQRPESTVGPVANSQPPRPPAAPPAQPRVQEREDCLGECTFIPDPTALNGKGIWVSSGVIAAEAAAARARGITIHDVRTPPDTTDMLNAVGVLADGCALAGGGTPVSGACAAIGGVAGATEAALTGDVTKAIPGFVGTGVGRAARAGGFSRTAEDVAGVAGGVATDVLIEGE